MSEPIVVAREGSQLVGERWSDGDRTVVFLHAGVADRRSWRGVVSRLEGLGTVVTYDRRGHGDSEPSDVPFSHVDDLLAVLDDVRAEAAWLVGSSMGGGVAMDAALVAPERVAGLVLLAPAISGAPEPELDARIQRFDERITEAMAAGDVDEANRLETWLWLDGPAGPEGRVGGDSRALALAMNEVILRHDVSEDAGASGVDAWSHLDQVLVPTTVACGDLDLAFLVARSRDLVGRLPVGRHRVLEGMAHLPYLERPEVVADLVSEAVTAP
jgi:pimeloyl-ACP methyl ester carboxylesterase